MSTATLTRPAQRNARAASVSRTLASNGLRPLPSGTSRMREGIRVRRGCTDTVHVVIDLDNKREREIVLDEAVAILRCEGFVVEVRNDGEFASLAVSHARIAL